MRAAQKRHRNWRLLSEDTSSASGLKSMGAWATEPWEAGGSLRRTSSRVSLVGLNLSCAARTVWPWANHQTSLFLHVVTCKMGLLLVPTSWICWDTEWVSVSKVLNTEALHVASTQSIPMTVVLCSCYSLVPPEVFWGQRVWKCPLPPQGNRTQGQRTLTKAMCPSPYMQWCILSCCLFNQQLRL